MTSKVSQRGLKIALKRQSGGRRSRPRSTKLQGLGHVNVETGCRSKQAYLSKADAKRVVRLMTSRHREGFHLYECPNCAYFHVGHIVPAFLRQPSAVQQGSASWR